jgi:hypothetical protein
MDAPPSVKKISRFLLLGYGIIYMPKGKDKNNIIHKKNLPDI